MNCSPLVLTTLLVLCTFTFNAQAMRPNFVLIIGDDISAADLGCYGNRGVRTPHLDRLARESLRFTRAYVTATSCSPSRCSLLTSRYPHNLETAAELHGALPGGLALFPQLLRDSGYFTAHAGKAHFGTQANQGVQRVVGPAEAAFEVSGDGEPVPGKGGYGGEEQWLHRLRNRPADRPFFLWLAAHDAHRVWDADDFAGRHAPAEVTVPPELLDTPETRQDLASYYDEIHRLDHHVGQVMEELRRQGVLEQTVILFLSDQGRPFPRAKTQVYEAGVLTPLIIRLPKTLGDPGVVDALVSSIDLGPTVLELAGLARPASFQGVSLTPLFRTPRTPVRDFAFAERNWHNFTTHIRLVRHGDYAYLRNAYPERWAPGASETFYNPSADALKAGYAAGTLTPVQADIFQKVRPAEELYDVRSDPNQEHNLIDRPGSAAVAAFLRQAMDQWQAETGDSVPEHPTPPDTDYATGRKFPGFQRGTPPGASTHALSIHRPGPIRTADVRKPGL